MPRVEYDRVKIEERKLEIRRILYLLGTPAPPLYVLGTPAPPMYVLGTPALSLTRSGDMDERMDVNFPTAAMTSESGKRCPCPPKFRIEC